MAAQITEVLYSDFQELVNINDTLSAFATPILPHSLRKKSITGAKGYQQGTSSSAVSVQDQYKQMSKKELIDSQFSMGKSDNREKEKGRARATRRKSFGEDLTAEIKANPELLHVREK
jgi:hypothetical protein